MTLQDLRIAAGLCRCGRPSIVALGVTLGVTALGIACPGCGMVCVGGKWADGPREARRSLPKAPRGEYEDLAWS